MRRKPPSVDARRSEQSLRCKFAFLEDQLYTRGRLVNGGTHIGSQRTSHDLLILYTLMSVSDDAAATAVFTVVHDRVADLRDQRSNMAPSGTVYLELLAVPSFGHSSPGRHTSSSNG